MNCLSSGIPGVVEVVAALGHAEPVPVDAEDERRVAGPTGGPVQGRIDPPGCGW